MSEAPHRPPGSALEVFTAFLTLGFTSFGGPLAHLGYFREAFVVRRRWLGDAAYADLVALCQFLPGPASSQVGMGIGLMRAGLPGLAAAWLGFTLPSAVLMAAFFYGLSVFGTGGWVDGLKAAAVAVVAHAVLGMLRSLAPDRERATIAAGGFALALLIAGVSGQLLAMGFGLVAGLVWLRSSINGDGEALRVRVPRWLAVAALAAFVALLAGLPLLAAASPEAGFIERFYRAGSLVFGGGHVVLPLLEAGVVDTGLVDRTTFLAGYGAAQAVPGPLFTFASFLGAAANTPPNGIFGATLATLAIFLPSVLLVVGALPFWAGLRRFALAQRALMGINAAVVGLLGAALYDPVFSEGIGSPVALVIAVAAFAGLTVWKLPAWAVVLAAGIAGLAVL